MKDICIECKILKNGNIDYYNFSHFYCYKCWNKIDKSFKNEFSEELKIRLNFNDIIQNEVDRLRNFRDIFRLCSLNFSYFSFYFNLMKITLNKINYTLENLIEYKSLLDKIEYKNINYWLNKLKNQISEDIYL